MKNVSILLCLVIVIGIASAGPLRQQRKSLRNNGATPTTTTTTTSTTTTTTPKPESFEESKSAPASKNSQKSGLPNRPRIMKTTKDVGVFESGVKTRATRDVVDRDSQWEYRGIWGLF